MHAILTSLKDPVWVNEEHTAIDCFIKTSQLGDEVLPFTATLDDPEPHGRAIFADLVNGVYGPIAEYVRPVAELPQPQVTGVQTL